MKLIFSPYFTSHPYRKMDSGKVIIDQKSVDKSSLLAQLELRMGMSYGNEDITQKRLEEYHSMLCQVIPQDHLLYNSFKIDDSSNDSQQYVVTSTILGWRDSLLLAGWNGESLKSPKLGVISDAEGIISEDSVIHKGEADRWKALLKTDITRISEDFSIEVVCPKIIIEPLIRQVLDRFNANYCFDEDANVELVISKASIVTAPDITDAYKYIAFQNPTQDVIVACRETDRLDCILRSLDKPMAGSAEVGCHQVVSDLRDCVDAPKSLVWLDCNGDYGFRYPYEFMNSEELENVSETLIEGCSIPRKLDMLYAVQQFLYFCLNKIEGNVVYVSSKKDTGSILPEHPIVTWLKYKKVNNKDLDASNNIKMMTSEKEEIRFTPKAEYQLNHCDADSQDVVMSFSSMEQILQTPFDFVVERKCEMKDASDTQDIVTLMGNVAHRVIKLIVKGEEGNECNEISTDNYDSLFSEAIELEDKCSLLNKKENTFVRQQFKKVLNESIEVLCSIISDNHLSVVASEMKIPIDEEERGVEIEGIGLAKGTIDLVLKNDKDEYFIFDFKYSTSSYNPDKLAKNRSVQFEMYRRLFDQYCKPRKIKAMGYYLFPLATLFMSENDFNESGFKGEHIQPVALDTNHQDDVWNAIASSYKFRKDQLKKGIIEEGEGMEIKSLDYGNKNELFALKPDSQKNTIKASAYAPKHIVLKNQIR